jgi:glycosyltransferase involved in cell wall biosynthesis
MHKPLHIHHVFSSFNLGGLEARSCTLMNTLGDGFRHTITATDGNLGAVNRISPAVRFDIAPAPPGKGSVLYPLRVAGLLQSVQPDLLVTYNWGAFDAVLAATMNSICPVVHTEDGFNPDEVVKLKSRRVWSRRLVLNQVSAVVMPSRTLREIALNSYRIRPGLVHWIPNGIDTAKYGDAARQEWRARWGVSESDFLIGTMGRLAPEKNLGLLLRAMAECRFPDARLVLPGAGPCRPELEALAAALGIAGRVIFPGFIPDPHPCYGAFDLFAMSSTTEQMPIALLEAMATGLAVICTNVGDSAEILDNPGWPAIVPPGNVEAYAKALRTLYEDSALRLTLGARNRLRCTDAYSLERMVARYRHIYLSAAGQTL